MAEHRIVAPKVTGSTPVGHPTTWSWPHARPRAASLVRRRNVPATPPGRGSRPCDPAWAMILVTAANARPDPRTARERWAETGPERSLHTRKERCHAFDHDHHHYGPRAAHPDTARS